MEFPNPRLAVVLSYSGIRSHCLAKGIERLIRLLLPRLDPWFYGPEGGTRHLQDLGEVLDRVSFGVACLTPENLQSRWIHFEAGALSKHRDSGRLVPFVWECKLDNVDPPLNQFGARPATVEGARKLMDDLASAFGQGRPTQYASEAAWRNVIAQEWRQIRGQIRGLGKMTEAFVDGNNPVHVQLLRHARTIQEETTPLRQFIAREILAEAELAIKEIADREPLKRSSSEFVDLVEQELAVPGVTQLLALCGGKPWGESNRRRYYQACFHAARQLRQVHKLKPGQAMTRIFIPKRMDAGGLSPWPNDDWRVLMEHRQQMSECATRALVLQSVHSSDAPAFELVNGDVAENGVGFLIVARGDGGVVFSHRGGESEPFRSGVFRSGYAVREFRRLFEVLRTNSWEFDPNDWPNAKAKRKVTRK